MERLKQLSKWDDRFLPNAKLNGASITVLFSPIVYCWKRGEDYLYVGCSRNGLARIFHSKPNTSHVCTLYGIKEDDEFLLWHCKSVEYMKELEKALIIVLQPKHNKNKYKKKSLAVYNLLKLVENE